MFSSPNVPVKRLEGGGVRSEGAPHHFTLDTPLPSSSPHIRSGGGVVITLKLGGGWVVITFCELNSESAVGRTSHDQMPNVFSSKFIFSFKPDRRPKHRE